MRQPRLEGDAGTTLVELLVAMVLLAVVGTITMGGVITTNKIFRQVDDDATGLADARKVAERLGRDIRNARGVDSGATASRLVLWIDTNSDYRRAPSESVAWELRPGTNTGQFDVIRIQGGVTEIIEARSLVSDIAFVYDQPAPATRLVTTSVDYDAYLGHSANTRTLYFGERLRNVDES